MSYSGLKDMKVCAKSDKKANELRESGNNYYKQGEMMEALICYNKSITFASSKKVLSLGYANRSAVYLSLECKEECLKNIEWARENGYENSTRLNEREEKGNKIAESGWKNVIENPWNFFKLSYPANKKIPWIVDCLEVRTTQKYGRGIYTTKDLKAGDIISIEEPMFFLTDDGFYKHCMNCHKSCMMNLIPCAQTASMMFCSTDCMDDFYSKSIEIELSLNLEMKMLTELAAPFGGYKKLDKFINKTNIKEQKTTIFDCDFSDTQDPNYKRNLMTCLWSLPSKGNHSVNNGSLDIFKYVSANTANHLIGIMYMNLANYQNNLKLDGFYIGIFRSLINHSCVFNVGFVSINNKLVTVVVRPVKAGEQIFCCYYDTCSPDHAIQRALVMKMFDFECDCQKCIDKSHQYKPIQFVDPATYTNRKNFQKAKEVLKRGWDLINTDAMPAGLFTIISQSIVTLTFIASFATLPC